MPRGQNPTPPQVQDAVGNTLRNFTQPFQQQQAITLHSFLRKGRQIHPEHTTTKKNKIILNKLLFEEENPRKIIRTLLHEARHAFQYFAVEHTWRAKPDESNIYSWDCSIENYISSDVDFNMYQSQSIEADADDFAERVV